MRLEVGYTRHVGYEFFQVWANSIFAHGKILHLPHKVQRHIYHQVQRTDLEGGGEIGTRKHVSADVDERTEDCEGKEAVEEKDNGEALPDIIDLNIDERLSQAGTDKSKILEATVFLTNLKKDFTGFDKEWRSWLPEDIGASRATVGVAQLANNYKVEIKVTVAA